MVVARAEVPGGFGGLIFFLGNCLCLRDHADYFFLGVSPGLLAARPCGVFLKFPFSCLFTA